MNNTEVKKEQTKQELIVKYKIDDNEITLTPAIVQNYIVGSTKAKINLVEFRFFTELCKVRKLNPFLNEAYLIKYKEDLPAQLVVGKDAILKRAVLNPSYDGMESGVIVANKDTGEEIERQGTFIPKNCELVGGWARVYVKGRNHPSYTSVNFNEVAQRKANGELNSNWSGKSATMVEKVAKVRALREAFVEDLGGMYDEDEFKTELQDTKQVGSNKVIEVQEEKVEVNNDTGEVVNIEEI